MLMLSKFSFCFNRRFSWMPNSAIVFISSLFGRLKPMERMMECSVGKAPAPMTLKPRFSTSVFNSKSASSYARHPGLEMNCGSRNPKSKESPQTHSDGSQKQVQEDQQVPSPFESWEFPSICSLLLSGSLP